MSDLKLIHNTVYISIKLHENTKPLLKKNNSPAAVFFFVFYNRLNNYVILFFSPLPHFARLSKWVNTVLLFMVLVSIAWLRECVHLGLLHIAVSLFFFASCFHGSDPALLFQKTRRDERRFRNKWLTGWINSRSPPPLPPPLGLSLGNNYISLFSSKAIEWTVCLFYPPLYF